MNNQNNTTGSVKMGDVWEVLSTKKQHYNRSREKDNIIFRLKKTKGGNIGANLQVGVEICELLQWKKNDKLTVMRNKLNGTCLKIIKSTDDTGYKLHEPNKNPCRMNICMTFDFHKKYIVEHTKIINFELQKDHLIVDFSNLCTA